MLIGGNDSDRRVTQVEKAKPRERSQRQRQLSSSMTKSLVLVSLLFLPVVCSFLSPRFASRRHHITESKRGQLISRGAYEPLLQDEVTDVVYFEVAEEDPITGPKPIGRIEIGLYGNVVPKTVLNFKDLFRCLQQIQLFP